MRAGKARCILLVDDHVEIREAVARTLAQEGVGRCREAAGPQRDLVRAARDVLEGWTLVSPRAAEGLRSPR